MELYYSDEKNIQIVVALLKSHGIRKVIVSPGATNISLVTSLQYDGSFEMYSSVDERSAAYIACGLAAESGEPVVLSCTGATASRNYLPGLTEAYYRHLPILAITSTQPQTRIGHDIPQVIDRTVVQNDVVRMSVEIPVIKDDEDEWRAVVDVNRALLELKHKSGGPVHINLAATLIESYGTKKLPQIRMIKRYSYTDVLPTINGKIAIHVGSHPIWSKELTQEVEYFCEKYNAVVLGNHVCNYKGRYHVNSSLAFSQDYYFPNLANIDILISFGDISGSYIDMKPRDVWRIDSDGMIKDPIRKLKNVFEMKEIDFFKYYNAIAKNVSSSSLDYYVKWKEECDELMQCIPDIPFSNVWVAKSIIGRLPKDSCIHFGIYNTLRVWDFFNLPENVCAYCNTGGFGIDGGYSSAVGASLANPNKLVFIVAGDLGFFYDMNVLGNRHIGKNLRIALINNGRGTEFTQYNHRGAILGEKADEYVSAAGHFGKQSRTLVKNYCENLGFRYFSAENKEDFNKNIDNFLSPQISNSMVLEIFVDSRDESNALKTMRNIRKSGKKMIKSEIKNIIGTENVKRIKKIID